MLIGMLLAGQHTSSTTSSWVGFFLAKNKHVQVGSALKIQGTHCTGKVGKMAQKKSVSENREFGNVAKTQGKHREFGLLKL